MIYIGCHLSVANGYAAMGRTMSEFGGNTFAWFTRTPRGGKTSPLVPNDVAKLRQHSLSQEVRGEVWLAICAAVRPGKAGYPNYCSNCRKQHQAAMKAKYQRKKES